MNEISMDEKLAAGLTGLALTAVALAFGLAWLMQNWSTQGAARFPEDAAAASEAPSSSH